MEIDEDRVDDAVLALLWLTLHGGDRAWKGHDWDALGRLHAKGMIFDPVGKARSMILTEEGLRESRRLFEALFSRRAGEQIGPPDELQVQRVPTAAGPFKR